MVRLIKFLITGIWSVHQHEWKIIEKHDLFDAPWGVKTIVGKVYVQECATCGKLNQYTVRG